MNTGSIQNEPEIISLFGTRFLKAGIKGKRGLYRLTTDEIKTDKAPLKVDAFSFSF